MGATLKRNAFAIAPCCPPTCPLGSPQWWRGADPPGSWRRSSPLKRVCGMCGCWRPLLSCSTRCGSAVGGVATSPMPAGRLGPSPAITPVAARPCWGRSPVLGRGRPSAGSTTTVWSSCGKRMVASSPAPSPRFPSWPACVRPRRPLAFGCSSAWPCSAPRRGPTVDSRSPCGMASRSGPSVSCWRQAAIPAAIAWPSPWATAWCRRFPPCSPSPWTRQP